MFPSDKTSTPSPLKAGGGASEKLTKAARALAHYYLSFSLVSYYFLFSESFSWDLLVVGGIFIRPTWRSITTASRRRGFAFICAKNESVRVLQLQFARKSAICICHCWKLQDFYFSDFTKAFAPPPPLSIRTLRKEGEGEGDEERVGRITMDFYAKFVSLPWLSRSRSAREEVRV